MENTRYPYSAFPTRPKLEWPGGARVALLVVLNVEYFRFDRPASDLDWRGPQPDVDAYAQRDYGPRVGFWRLLELFDRHRIPITAAVNAEVFGRYPEIVAAGIERGWEWTGHGATNSRSLAGLEESEERELIAACAATIERHTGKRPRGWLGPRVVETHNTPDLLAEAGFTYTLDWSADDQPFEIATRSGAILSVPYTRELNDLPTMVRRNHTAEQFHDMVIDQFDVFHAEGGRVMAISLHPFVSGHPYRARWIDRALGYIRARDGTWFATGAEIADWYREALG
jgi:peptidoglycan/xylan/chitin deacetylase (PgdA/CDA1 family)